MSLDNTAIVLSSEPKGKWIEGIISGTPKPGTCVQLTPGQTPPTPNGSAVRWTYRVWTGDAADGERDEVMVLDADWLQGKTETDAYVDGDVCFIYIPGPGDELKVLKGDAAGTGDDVTVGMKMIIDSGTGKVIPTTGSPEMEPFKALEALTDPTEDQLIHVRYTGQ